MDVGGASVRRLRAGRRLQGGEEGGALLLAEIVDHHLFMRRQRPCAPEQLLHRQLHVVAGAGRDGFGRHLIPNSTRGSWQLGRSLERALREFGFVSLFLMTPRLPLRTALLGRVVRDSLAQIRQLALLARPSLLERGQGSFHVRVVALLREIRRHDWSQKLARRRLLDERHGIDEIALVLGQENVHLPSRHTLSHPISRI